MHVAEHLAKATRPLFSFEVVPPARGHTAAELIDVINELMVFNPSWVDVTSHAPSAQYRERADGSVERIVSKKRPGTLGICGVIQNRLKLDTVAHLLCLGFTREETEDALIELNYLGVHNVLALRGDGPNFQKNHSPGKTSNRFACELVEQLQQVNRGQYLSELDGGKPLDFCVGVAGYPEKHFEAPNMKTDIAYLKQKIDAGATYIVTQMFFDNDVYFRFVDQCRAAGITVPIVPGLKVLKSPGQMNSIARTFHCDLPDSLVEAITESPQHAADIGAEHTYKQCMGLLEKGAPALHFYILNDVGRVKQVVQKLGL